MKPKTVVAAALLAFVATSVLYLVMGEGKRAPAEASGEAAMRGAASAGSERAETQVIAYYFHGSVRCRTCLSIENTAREALEAGLPEALASGALQWRAVDYEQPENEHFAKEFELTGASLILVKEAGGRVARWGNLEQVWDLIDEEDRFRAYVLDQARGYLEES